jgi:RNA polymerase sigma-32 factor
MKREGRSASCWTVTQRTSKLSREEELELTSRFREGRDREAAGRLLQGHLRGVIAVATRYRRYGVPLDELVAEGAFGMVLALQKFEPGRGIRFATYADHWIRAYVLEHVIRSWSLVGGGAGPLRSRLFFRVRRERRRVTALLGEGPDADRELARRLQVSEEVARDMVQRLEARDVSVERRVGGDDSPRLLDLFPADSDQEKSLTAHQEQRLRELAVAEAIPTLDARERFIAERRLMAEPAEELSLAEISRHMGVSRERARQLETRTKRKLRERLAGLR